ncbi:hypothetical protein LX73_1185 [Fodinibius salinus]|uniref:Uncharacterized protein n=1 Tax=Fodinibius salinus TaxID=860790 RepID=A0A5D3YLB1_9BACT|nr:hypothetical protein [Fodinibius salinus]TYP93481.1 hypothetical protein LX73_1185 [Fodinibius salinus]
MEPLLKRALLTLLVFGLFSINGIQAGDRNEENPIKYSNDYKKYGDKVVSMSVKNFESFEDISKIFLGDCSTGGLANVCCPYWNVTVEWGFMGPTITCETGGEFKCQDNCGDDGDGGDIGEGDPGFEEG